MFGFGKKESTDLRSDEPQVDVEKEAEIEALKDEREELREAIAELQSKLSDLRSNFREAESTYNESMQEMRDRFIKQEDELRKRIHDLATKSANDTAKYEHEYHSTREQKGVELAAIETRIAMLKEQEAEIQNSYKLNEVAWKKVIESRDREMKSILDNKDRDFLIVLSSKDAEIERQHRIIMELTRHIGSIAVPNYATAPAGVQGTQGTQGIVSSGPQNKVRH